MEFYFKNATHKQGCIFCHSVLQYDNPVPRINFVNTVPSEQFRSSAMLFFLNVGKLKGKALRSSQTPQLSDQVQ